MTITFLLRDQIFTYPGQEVLYIRRDGHHFYGAELPLGSHFIDADDQMWIVVYVRPPHKGPTAFVAEKVNA